MLVTNQNKQNKWFFLLFCWRWRHVFQHFYNNYELRIQSNTKYPFNKKMFFFLCCCLKFLWTMEEIFFFYLNSAEILFLISRNCFVWWSIVNRCVHSTIFLYPICCHLRCLESLIIIIIIIFRQNNNKKQQ